MTDKIKTFSDIEESNGAFYSRPSLKKKAVYIPHQDEWSVQREKLLCKNSTEDRKCFFKNRLANLMSY